MPKKVMKKGKNKRHYFTQEHEDAIVKYANSDCIKERTQLYIDLIQLKRPQNKISKRSILKIYLKV